MDPSRTGPVALAEARLEWLERRQQALSRNIAHADTPGYRSVDITPFADLLARRGEPELRRTNVRHLASPGGVIRARADRTAPEQAPNGNSVSLEEQAIKIADTDSAHALAVNLHRRFLGLFRTTLGRSG